MLNNFVFNSIVVLRIISISIKMIFLFGLLLTVLMYFLIKFSTRKKRIMKYVGHLPSPKEYPFIGSGLHFIGKNTERTLHLMLINAN